MASLSDILPETRKKKNVSPEETRKMIEARDKEEMGLPEVRAQFRVNVTVEVPRIYLKGIVEPRSGNWIHAIKELKESLPRLTIGEARDIARAWCRYIEDAPSEAANPSQDCYKFRIRRTLTFPMDVMHRAVGLHPHSIRHGIFELQRKYPLLSVDELEQVVTSWHQDVLKSLK